MSFIDLALNRQSDRSFDPGKQVEPEKIEQILQAARLAPSACNSQPWSFVVVTDETKRMEMSKAISGKVLNFNHFAFQAPLHIVIVEEKKNLTSSFGAIVKDKDFALVDIGIVSSYITLAASSLGLGSCVLGWFDEAKIKNILGIPKGKRALLDIVIGYSKQPLREKKRKSMEEIVFYDKYK
jgi:nitroreductase